MSRLRGRVRVWLIYAFAAALSILFLLPLVWVLSTSFKPNTEIYTTHMRFWPKHPTLGHYLGLVAALPQFRGYIFNSVIVTVL